MSLQRNLFFLIRLIPLFFFVFSPSCFSEVHSTPGPNYSSPQAGVSSSGGLVSGVSPPIPQRQGAPPPGPPICQNTYPPGPSLGLRHSYPCLGQQQHQHQQQPQQQGHVKPEHRGHYAPGWVWYHTSRWKSWHLTRHVHDANGSSSSKTVIICSKSCIFLKQLTKT